MGILNKLFGGSKKKPQSKKSISPNHNLSQEENGNTVFGRIFTSGDNLSEAEKVGKYTMWSQLPEDVRFLNSPIKTQLTDIAEGMAGYECVFAGLLLHEIHGLEKKRIALPEEDLSLILNTSENKKCAISIGKEKGIRFQLSDDTDFIFRKRFYNQVARSVKIAREQFDEMNLPKDEHGEENPIGWFRFMIRAMEENNMAPAVVGGFEYFPKNKFKAIEGINFDKVYPRINIHISGENNETITKSTTVNIPKEYQPIIIPFQEDIGVSLAVDMGEHYQYINNKLMSENPNISQEQLFAQAKANVLSEVEGNIKMHGNINSGYVMITNGGNHEAPMILFDEFWDQIQEQFGTEICVVFPVRDVLYVGNFYNPEALEKLRDCIRKFFYVPNQKGILSNGIYLRKDGGWKRIETVEAII